MEHRLIPKDNINLIYNIKKDDIEVLLKYIINFDNSNDFKIIIGNKDIPLIISELYPMDNDEEININNKNYKISEISEMLCHRLFFIEKSDETQSNFEYLLNDMLNILNNNIEKNIIIGIDNTDNNIDYIKINSLLSIINNKNKLYVYQGLEK